MFGGVHIFNNVRNQWIPEIDMLLDLLRQTGIDVITHNCEYSASQFEINYGPGLGLAVADKAFNFKHEVKATVHRQGSSEERRVGQERVSTCNSKRAPYHYKKK